MNQLCILTIIILFSLMLSNCSSSKKNYGIEQQKFKTNDMSNSQYKRETGVAYMERASLTNALEISFNNSTRHNSSFINKSYDVLLKFRALKPLTPGPVKIFIPFLKAALITPKPINVDAQSPYLINIGISISKNNLDLLFTTISSPIGIQGVIETVSGESISLNANSQQSWFYCGRVFFDNISSTKKIRIVSDFELPLFIKAFNFRRLGKQKKITINKILYPWSQMSVSMRKYKGVIDKDTFNVESEIIRKVPTHLEQYFPD